MQKAARGFIIATIVLATALPLLYVGSEGIWYLPSESSHFEPGTTYRTVYAPLDWAGDRWPRVYDGRPFLANGWLRLRGDSSREAYVRPTHPWVVQLQMITRDVERLHAANEFARIAGAAETEQRMDNGESSEGTTDDEFRSLDATDSQLD